MKENTFSQCWPLICISNIQHYDSIKLGTSSGITKESILILSSLYRPLVQTATVFQRRRVKYFNFTPGLVTLAATT